MPTTAQVHIDRALTNFALARPGQEFIADALFPVLTSQKKSDYYYTFDNGQEFQRQTDDQLNPRAETREVDFATTTTQFDCVGHGLKDFIPFEVDANTDDIFSLRADTVEFLLQKVRINREIAAKAALDAALTGNQTSAATAAFSNESSATPIVDINTAITQIETAGGVRPNVMAMDSTIWRNLKKHPDVIERVVSGGTSENPADISRAGVAALFDLETIAVTSAVKNTAIHAQTASLSRVWSTDVYLAYVPPAASRKNFAMGKTFTWIGGGANDDGYVVESWMNNDPKGEYIKVWAYYVQKVTAATAGYRLSGC